jgi:hypothetical protein
MTDLILIVYPAGVLTPKTTFIKTHYMKTSHYWKPTPVLMRKIGDSILAAGTLGGTLAAAGQYKWLGIVIFIACVLGKFITNFFKVDDVTTDPQNKV